MEYSTRGQHFKADFWGVQFDALNDESQLLMLMQAAAELAGATVLGKLPHRFEPHGVTAILLLSESHMSIHTYPEAGFCAIDCYTCGGHVDPATAIGFMADHLEPLHVQVTADERGVLWDGGEGNQSGKPH